MRTKTYPAIIFCQRQSSPLQVAFAAASSEIDEWARVPTKRTGNIRNFQRAELPGHIKEVKTFFDDQCNASPTAVVVGFDPIRAREMVRVDTASGSLEDSALVPGIPVTGEITITWPPGPIDSTNEERVSRIVEWRPKLEAFIFEELQDIAGLSTESTQRLLELVSRGLRTGSLRSIDFDDEASVPGMSLGESEANEEHSESDGDPATELNTAIQAELIGRSPGERQIIMGRLFFLGQLQREILEALPADRLAELCREVYDELKPGILIDGQHRIMGTKDIANVPFLVTALPSATWPELAFQFIVTNRTARRVPESLLINIVGNSLSQQQRKEIEGRLRNSNIRVGLIEAVMMVHEDEQSPFFGLLAFGLKNEPGFLDAAAMRGKVIKLWYERLTPVKELLEHFCEGRLAAERNEYWKSEQLWFDFFIVFWSAVKERYEGSDVFSAELKDRRLKTPVSRLMTATVLMIFQKAILSSLYRFLRKKDSTERIPISQSIPIPAALASLVRNQLGRLTPEFFQGWQLSGFDGSPSARDDLAEAIELVVSDERSVAQLKEGKYKHRLFKEIRK